MSDKTYKPGDYVLATKWSDGDPVDHWCVGFYHGQLACGPEKRYLVVDSDGNQFRQNGFRRIKKISAERGKFMTDNIPNIQQGYRSVWWWARCSIHKGGER